MKVLLIILAVLVLLALLPLGVQVRYDREGVALWVRVWLFSVRLLPKKAGGEKKPKKPKKPKGEKPEKEKPPQAEDHPKGGPLDLVRAALPLVKPALSGLKRRLTIRDLELQVVWAADDPADAAIGYGCANAALGTLWSVLEESFRVKKSRLGCSVDLDAAQPTVFADATLTLRLGQVVTLVLPLLVRFFRNTSRLKRERAENTKKEA